MGCNASVSNDKVVGITDQQIQQIYDGTISPISYQVFLKNFYFVSRYSGFYNNLSLIRTTQTVNMRTLFG